MSKKSRTAKFLLICITCLSALIIVTNEILQGFNSMPAQTNDWPQWRGPNRDGISSETDILKSWPENGPNVVWRIAVGYGYSSIAISNGKLYTMWSEGDDEVLFCLIASTGKEVWRYKIGRRFRNDQGDGPRSCPTVDGQVVYAAGAYGDLHAVDVESGKRGWSRSLVMEYGSRTPRWGYSSSPLVEGDMLLVQVGGRPNFGFMAFNKKTGDVIWSSQTDRPAYSSPLAITVNGTRQVLFFSASGLHSVASENGELLWDYPWKTSYNANIAIPIFISPDKVFISTNYGVGAAVIQIKGKSGKLDVETVWRNKKMKNHFNTSVLHDNHLFGFDNAIFKCIDAATGEEKWKTRGFQKGSLLFVDGHLIVLGERGRLALVEVDPSEYKEKASAQILKGKCWTMPTLAGGKLYLRNQKEMLCLDVSAGT